MANPHGNCAPQLWSACSEAFLKNVPGAGRDLLEKPSANSAPLTERVWLYRGPATAPGSSFVVICGLAGAGS